MAVDNWNGLRDYSRTTMVALSTTALLTACGAIYLLSRLKKRIRQMALWKVPGPPAVSFITGELWVRLRRCVLISVSSNDTQMHHVGAGQFHEHIIQTYGRVIRVSGFLWDTQLIISDPKACTSILLKDQDIFEETAWSIECNLHAFGPGLLGTLGAHHRKQRKQINPVFSAKHLRSMVPLFHKITNQLRDVLKAKVARSPQEVDILDWLGRLALELVAQGGLGYTFNSLDPEAKENEYGKAIKEFIPTTSTLVAFRTLFPLISHWPSWLLRFGAKFVPLPMVHNAIRITDIMTRYTKEVFDEKKALLEKGDVEFKQQLSEGKDIISVLMKTNGDALKEDRLPDDEIMGQMSSLILAATDTTSTALSRILDILARHPDVQEKLRQELKDAHARAGENELGYDELVELPYLEAVCRETLRVFPPVHFISRVARADASVPLSQPIETDGGPVSSLFVPRGTAVMINIIGANRDPSIWGADAADWKPERWLAPLPDSVADARIPGIYSNTLTFLGGGRACIGFKFSQLEMKVALSQLVTEFRFSPSKEEIVWRFGGITTPSVKGSTALAP
ncbi:cytochrome P450 [Artomyces pyxidatus]|uniref:Cytochrome P450 n=1 Tax=Artomyces pyxidatus TaxID=48021 RepID=A0ACB8SU68_9AGAM|nr:cytochrome P450 [Artomyces pyxidatus]